jgi:hypothetical protein
MPSKIMFISHSKKDKAIADKLVDLIETGIGISSEEIFCSSLEGMSIPSGNNFISFIKTQITDPEVVVLLLSPSYYKSTFCLCELGAAWVRSLKIIPIMVPPLDYDDIKDVLTGIQILKISKETDLNQMQSDITTSLKITGKPFAKWEAKRNEFIESISDIISEIPPEPDITEMTKEIERLNQEIKDLKKAKDASEVTRILMTKKIDQLIQEIKDLKKVKDASEVKVTSMSKEIDRLNQTIKDLKKVKDASEVKVAVFGEMDNDARSKEVTSERKKSSAEFSPMAYSALYQGYN